MSDGSVPRLAGHGLRFKTKADKRKAEEERKENEKLDGSATEMKKGGGGSPQPLADPHTELQQQTQLPV